MKTEIQGRGYYAEQMVVDYLTQQGYGICARNYTIRAGEIDIIACKAEVVAFIEVKMRSKRYFNLSLVVDRAKQKKIIATALHYAAKNNYTQHVLRFDVALVEPNMHDSTFDITFIPNAFTASERVL
ncbi:MAG: YraN family protein [Candidatus Babeliaceae bacterium]|nr:YraN family protein [Candidatus Babeliaceae bacterium]